LGFYKALPGFFLIKNLNVFFGAQVGWGGGGGGGLSFLGVGGGGWVGLVTIHTCGCAMYFVLNICF
jgi:hypothetical protein